MSTVKTDYLGDVAGTVNHDVTKIVTTDDFPNLNGKITYENYKGSDLGTGTYGANSRITTITSYTPGTNQIKIRVGGAKMRQGFDYDEVDANTIDMYFSVPSETAVEVEFVEKVQLGVTDAANVSLTSRTKNASNLQAEYDAAGQWDTAYLNDLVGADLSAMQVGDVVRVRAVSSAHPTAPAAWKLVAIGATPPDATSGINSDGYFYDAASSARKFEVVPTPHGYFADWFGCKKDGSDDAPAIKSALAFFKAKAEDFALILRGEYNFASDLGEWDSSVCSMVLDAFGAKVTYSGTGVLLTLMTTSGGAFQPLPIVLGGMWIGPGNTSGTECFRIQDVRGAKLEFCYVKEFGIGFHLRNWITWTELTSILNCVDDNCQHGIYFSPASVSGGTGTESFARTRVLNFWCGGGVANKAKIHCQGGVYDGQFGWIGGNIVDDVVIFHLEGSMGGTKIGQVAFENQGGTTQTGVLFEWGTFSGSGPDIVERPVLRNNIIFETGSRPLMSEHLYGNLEVDKDAQFNGDVLIAGLKTLTFAAGYGVDLQTRRSAPLAQSNPALYYSISGGAGYPFDAYGHLVIESRSEPGFPRDIVFLTGDPPTVAAAVKLSQGTGETALLLRYDNGTAVTTQVVSVGAADSGGVGFRLLRVPN